MSPEWTKAAEVLLLTKNLKHEKDYRQPRDHPCEISSCYRFRNYDDCYCHRLTDESLIDETHVQACVLTKFIYYVSHNPQDHEWFTLWHTLYNQPVLSTFLQCW